MGAQAIGNDGWKGLTISHNPKVVGSNPASATKSKPVNTVVCGLFIIARVTDV